MIAHPLASKREARIKRELPVEFISKEEMKDGFTETASPEYFEQMLAVYEQMLAVYEEMIATTDQPFLRVM